MAKTTETFVTKTVTPGKGGTGIQKDKYDATRKALLKVIPRKHEGIAFRDLPKLVKPLLPKDMLVAPGSASWLVTVVKLDLEARGLIERIPRVTPQHVRRTRQKSP